MVIREAAVDVGIEEMVLAGQTRDQLLDHRARRAVAGVPADAERSAIEILKQAIDIKIHDIGIANSPLAVFPVARGRHGAQFRSEEHTSELQSLMRISYAVFCLKNKNKAIN